MKLDCISIVDEKNTTLWVRSGVYPLQQAYQALRELEARRPPAAAPGQALYLGRSFVDGFGKEQVFELALPFVLAQQQAEVSAARVEVWHRNTLAHWFGQEVPEPLTRADYHRAGVLLVADNDYRLDQAFHFSQNLEAVWNPVKPCRSTSVGDVLVVTSGDATPTEAYAVMPFGFAAVTFPE